MNEKTQTEWHFLEFTSTIEWTGFWMNRGQFSAHPLPKTFLCWFLEQVCWFLRIWEVEKTYAGFCVHLCWFPRIWVVKKVRAGFLEFYRHKKRVLVSQHPRTHQEKTSSKNWRRNEERIGLQIKTYPSTRSRAKRAASSNHQRYGWSWPFSDCASWTAPSSCESLYRCSCYSTQEERWGPHPKRTGDPDTAPTRSPPTACTKRTPRPPSPDPTHSSPHTRRSSWQTSDAWFAVVEAPSSALAKCPARSWAGSTWILEAKLALSKSKEIVSRDIVPAPLTVFREDFVEVSLGF